MILVRRLFAFAILLSLSVGLSCSALAAVNRVEISSDRLYAGGTSFGAVGQYREISGTLYFTVDPNNTHNQIIVGLEQAPVNSQGLVEFSSDFYILTPANPDRANPLAIIDIPNRGNLIIQRFNQAEPGRPDGDGFLMNQGYSLIWTGWEDDINSGLRISLPKVGSANLSVSGLGYAAVRDLGSWIKYSPEALIHSDYLLSFGLSQSGRFLRNYLYLGFNSDETGRQVFDGLIPHIAGSSRISLNALGARPVSQGQFIETSYPFSDDAYEDPVTGLLEGTQGNPRARVNRPKIFYTNSSVEYWGGGRVAALVHTTPDAQRDIVLPENVRAYLLAGTQHVPVPFPPDPVPFPPDKDDVRQQPNNPHNYWWRMRALLIAMTDWIVEGTEPPPSRHPRLDDGTLIPVADFDFPPIAGDVHPERLNAGFRVPNLLLDQSGGAGAPLPLLVPQINPDGNEIGGIPSPDLLVPLASYTGWNFNSPSHDDPLRLFPLQGSYLPFAFTRQQRVDSWDPRLSIEERYQSKAAFLDLIADAAADLVEQRYLLAEDVPAIVQHASVHWDYLQSTP